MKLIFIVLLLIINPLEKPKEHCQEMIQTAIKALHKKEHLKSLELLINAQNIANTHQWHKEEFLAFNNIGNNYYQLSAYGEALENYLAAYDVAVIYLTPQMEMVVLNNVGILYFEEKKFKEAENYFLKAYTIAREYNETVKLGIYAINLGLVNNKLNNLDKATQYLEIAFPLLQNDKNILLQGKYALAENLYLKGDLKTAISILNVLIHELREAYLFEHQSEAYLLLSKIYSEQSDFLRAKRYGLVALKCNGSLEVQIKINEQLSLLAYKSNEYTESIKFRDSVILLKDSLYRVNSKNQFEANRVKFNIKQYEKELADNTHEFNVERRLYYILLITFGLLLLTSVWTWRVNIAKLKQKKIITERNQKIKMLELEGELESKNRKLTARALNMATRNEILLDIMKILNENTELTTRDDIQKIVHELKMQVKKDAGWKDFLIHFEEANYGFLKTLKEKHPKLNTNDIRFLSYLYMNLSIKEIASMFNITPDACRKRKERIGKKMGLQNTSFLYDYISQLQ